MAGINMPGQIQRRESGLDKIAKALDVASTVYGIYDKYDSRSKLEEQKKQQETSKPYEEEREFVKLGAQISEQPKEGFQKTTFSDGTTKYIKMPQKEVVGRTAEDRQAARDAAAINKATIAARQKLQTGGYKISTTEKPGYEPFIMPDDTVIYTRNQKAIDAEINKHTKEVKGINEVKGALQEFLSDIPGGLESDADIPGFGSGAIAHDLLQSVGAENLATRALSPEGQKLRAKAAGVSNFLLKESGGVSLTVTEEARKLKEIASNKFSTDAELREATNSLLNRIQSNVAGLEAGLSAGALEELYSRPNALTAEAIGGLRGLSKELKEQTKNAKLDVSAEEKRKLSTAPKLKLSPEEEAELAELNRLEQEMTAQAKNSGGRTLQPARKPSPLSRAAPGLGR